MYRRRISRAQRRGFLFGLWFQIGVERHDLHDPAVGLQGQQRLGMGNADQRRFGQALDGLGVWWTNYQTANDEEREQMVKDIGKQGGARAASKPRRRRGPRKPKTDAAPGGNE
mgnify:CR=1 FL=1